MSVLRNVESSNGQKATKSGADFEIGTIKFIKENDELNVSPQTKLIGLTKEQLEQYRNDPFWKSIRYILFIAFWLLWLGMFVGAVLIVILSPKCAKSESLKQKWHENTISYQIYTPTFYDSDSDGVGDLQGVAKKLIQLRRIGVTSIRVSPILATLKDEFKPANVIDALAIDERFGTEADLIKLIEAVHAVDMHIILDLPLTKHLSQKLAGNSKPLESSKENVALLDVADLRVQDYLVEVASHLLRLGVDAIQLADYGQAKKMSSVKSLDPIISKIREFVKNDESIKQKEVVIIVEWAWRNAASFADIYLRPILGTDSDNSAAAISGKPPLLTRLANTIDEVARVFPKKQIQPRPMWTFADLATPRLDQQIDLNPILENHTKETMALLSLIQLILPGPISIYYGEEYGLESIKPTSTQYPQRGIMRWNAKTEPNVGFSDQSGQTFFGDLPRNEAYESVAFEQQYTDKNSQLRTFKSVAELRARSVVLQSGLLSVLQDGVYVYIRHMDGNDTNSEVFALAVNWPVNNNTIARVIRAETLRPMIGTRALTRVEVKAAAPRAAVTQFVGRTFNLEQEFMQLKPYEAVLFRII